MGPWMFTCSKGGPLMPWVRSTIQHGASGVSEVECAGFPPAMFAQKTCAPIAHTHQHLQWAQKSPCIRICRQAAACMPRGRLLMQHGGKWGGWSRMGRLPTNKHANSGPISNQNQYNAAQWAHLNSQLKGHPAVLQLNQTSILISNKGSGCESCGLLPVTYDLWRLLSTELTTFGKKLSYTLF